MIRALYNRNYRVFFIGQGLSAAGTWTQNIAMSWLIYRLTDSAWMLGLVAFASQIPNFLLAPVAGVWVDRLPKQRVLIATQILSLIQALALTILTLAGNIEIWHILSLSLFLGCINAIDVPARHAMTVQMVTKQEDKHNALALNSVTYNMARLLGPTAAGILIPIIGEGLCFLLNSMSYLVSILSLAVLKIKENQRPVCQDNVFQSFIEGYSYTFGQLPLRNILLLLGVVSLTGIPYVVLLPIFAAQNLAGGAGTLGLLMAISGFGSVVGALFLASRLTFLGLDKLLAVASALIGISLTCFVFASTVWFSSILMFCLGIGFILQIVGSNTLLQSMVDDSLRGRVMSFYTMILMGVGPFGSLLSGALASKIGVVYTLTAGGICCLAGAALFIKNISVFRIKACPIYVQAGSLSSHDECRF